MGKGWKLWLVLLTAVVAFGAVDDAFLRYGAALSEHREALRSEDSLLRAEQADLAKLPDQESRVALEKAQHLKLDSLQVGSLREARLARIDSLRALLPGYAVLGPESDTLFSIHCRLGATTPAERALQATRRIGALAATDTFDLQRLVVIAMGSSADVAYADMVLFHVSGEDALWADHGPETLANLYRERLAKSLSTYRERPGYTRIGIRVGQVALIILAAWLLFRGIIFLHGKAIRHLTRNSAQWLRELRYRDYTFLSVDQELRVLLVLVRIGKWVTQLLLLYIAIPMVFSLFPFTRGWADTLFGLVWAPFRNISHAVWAYLPNVFTIAVVFLVFKFALRLVRYVFQEIADEKLKITGFYPDWAMPTYRMLVFLGYAFMFIIIFPYLPGSDSPVFKGVSVFLGVLFSLGSSSAIANMVAGIIITYMRPFRLGDRILIGDIRGEVIEKSMLVTRLRTPKNEVVTIPNSSVLTGNTVNYSAYADTVGYIVHTTVSLGYDVPWPKIHEALLEAARRCDDASREPSPFVLQTSLDDFYVSYQLNVYNKDAGKEPRLRSQLHQHIQTVCAERGIEILSPHYRAGRDGNACTIPLPQTLQQPRDTAHETPGAKKVD